MELTSELLSESGILKGDVVLKLVLVASGVSCLRVDCFGTVRRA